MSAVRAEIGFDMGFPAVRAGPAQVFFRLFTAAVGTKPARNVLMSAGGTIPALGTLWLSMTAIGAEVGGDSLSSAVRTFPACTQCRLSAAAVGAEIRCNILLTAVRALPACCRSLCRLCRFLEHRSHGILRKADDTAHGTQCHAQVCHISQGTSAAIASHLS